MQLIGTLCISKPESLIVSINVVSVHTAPDFHFKVPNHPIHQVYANCTDSLPFPHSSSPPG